MSGHTSSQITVQEQHQTAPIQTQSSTTQQQISQTMLPAITYDPLWDFKKKKKDKPITLVQQDGANCGCFAAGMAIASLIRAPWNVSKSTLDDAPEDYAVAVAKGIEDVAICDKLSAVGEMFDANSLVTAINTVLQAEECLPAEKVGKYMAKVVQFYTPEQLAELLTRASAKGVRVLIPYLANNDMSPHSSTVTCSESEMYKAHWCCIRLHHDKQSATPMVQIYEGNQSAIAPLPLDTVYQSNKALATLMDWNSYLDICGWTEQQKTITALRKRTQGNPASFPESADVLWMNSDNAYNSNQHLLETVNLRGQAILIGKKADALSRAPAALTPPPPAGGTE